MISLTSFFRKILLFSFLILITLGDFNYAQGAFNEKINYQGKLTNPSGVAVANGSYNIRFRLCTTSGCTDGADPIWIETLCYSADSGATCTGTGVDQRVSVAGGLFSVLAGGVSSLSAVDFNQTLYLEVQVGGSGATPSWETLTPRKALGAVPAAFEAKQLGGKTWAVPDAIGSGTANTGAFTTLSSTYSGVSDALTVTQSSTGKIVNLVGDSITDGIGLAMSIDSLTTGTGFDISSSSIAGAGSNSTKLFNLARTGANSNASHTAYGLYSAVTNTGATSTNVGGYFSASGATNNYGLIVENGNVGIGTTSPSTPLHVVKNQNSGTSGVIENNSTGTAAYSSLRILEDSSSKTLDLFHLNTNYSTSGILTAGRSFVDALDTGGLALSARNASGVIIFATGGLASSNERMRIDSSGNVGIGDTNPSDKRLSISASGAQTAAYYGTYIANTATSSTASINKYGAYISSTGTWNGAGANNYGLYVDTPTGGTNNYAAVFAGGNVGIGTAVPDAKLNVAFGQVSFGAVSTNALFNISTNFTSTGTNASGLRIVSTLTPVTDNNIFGLTILPIAGSGTENITTAEGIYIAPIVKGNSGTLTNVYGMEIAAQAASSTNAYGLYVAAPTGGSAINAAAYFGGNVGINTTAPQSLLDVQGAAGAAGTLTLASKELTVVDGDILGRINFNAPLESDGSDSILVGASIWAEADDTFSTTVNSTELVFATGTTAAATEKMRIDRDGNVGIGTTSPGYNLEVKNSTTPILTINNSGTAGYSVLNFQNTTGAYQGEIFVNGSAQTGFGGVNSFNFYTPNLITFMTGGTAERVRIDSSGNVGIGSNAPAANLTVAQGTTGVGTVSNLAGGITVTGVGTQFTNTFKVGDTITIGGQTVAISAIASDTSMTTAAITNLNSGVAYTLVGGTRLAVQGNGNVGIGTAAPGGILDISESKPASYSYFVHRNTATADVVNQVIMEQRLKTSVQERAAFQINTSFNTTTDASRNSLVNFYTANAGTWGSAMVINGGNVGIGTAAPSQLGAGGTPTVFEVHDADSYAFLGLTTSLTASSSYVGALQFGTTGASSSEKRSALIFSTLTADSATNVSGDLQFYTNNAGSVTQKMVITSSGNIGIGDTNPSDKRLSISASGAQTAAYYGTYIANTATSSTASINKYGAYISSTGTWNGASANNFGLYVDTPTGGTNNYAAVFAGGNVGIGTAAPARMLDISSTAPSFQMTDTTASAKSLRLTTDGNAANFYEAAGSAGDILSLDLANKRVGVGVAPAVKFDVRNGGAFSPSTNYTAYIGSYANIGGGDGTGSGLLVQAAWDYDASAVIAQFSALTAGYWEVPRMTVKSNGLVGIGTTAPQSLLDVQGAAGAAGILTLATKELTVVDGDVLGRINFNAPLESDGSDSILVGASIWAEADDTFSTTVNSTELVFATGTTAAATEKMRIDRDGYVGIGTTTPITKLQVSGTTDGESRISVSATAADSNASFSINNDARQWLIQENGWSGDNLVIHDQTANQTRLAFDSSGNIGINTTAQFGSGAGVIGLANAGTLPTTNPTGGGVLYADAGALKWRGSSGTVTTIAAADYAEYMPAKDDIEFGDIVSISNESNPNTEDKTAPFLVEKSSVANNAKIIGIISSFSGEEKPNGFYQPVALAGRVPVKVSFENGPIKKGDYITSSSVPGVAMKANKAGQVIGMALENYNESRIANQESSVSKVMVFVNPHWYGGEITESGALANADGEIIIAILGQSQSFKDMVKETVKEALASLSGTVRAAGEWTFGKITTQKLCVEDVCVDKNQLQEMLNNNTLKQAQNQTPQPTQSPNLNVTPEVTPETTVMPPVLPAPNNIEGSGVEGAAQIIPQPLPEASAGDASLIAVPEATPEVISAP